MSRKSFWAILVISAIAGGILYALPQIFIKERVERSGSDFTLIQFAHLDDGGDAYFQFAREVAD
ncbi:MAG: hypothetical protein Q8L24_02080, partial [bacterium]|nr:hypothetical protein [bacterium]